MSQMPTTKWLIFWLFVIQTYLQGYIVLAIKRKEARNNMISFVFFYRLLQIETRFNQLVSKEKDNLSQESFDKLDKARTPQDMDGTLTLIFAKLKTSWNIITKISALLQLRKKWILTKFEGCDSKNGPATPIWSFKCFWREIQIQCTKSLQIWYKVGTYWG